MGDEPMQPSGSPPEPRKLPKIDARVDRPLSAGQRLDRLIDKTKQFSAAVAQEAKSAADTAAPKLKQIGDAASAKMMKLSSGAATTMQIAATAAEKSTTVGDAALRPPDNQAGGFFSTRLQLVRNYFNAGGKLRKALIIYGGFLILALLLSPIALLLPEPGAAGGGSASTDAADLDAAGMDAANKDSAGYLDTLRIMYDTTRVSRSDFKHKTDLKNQDIPNEYIASFLVYTSNKTIIYEIDYRFSAETKQLTRTYQGVADAY